MIQRAKALAGLAALLALLAPAPAARAGVYEVRECDRASGLPASDGVGVHEDGNFRLSDNDCATAADPWLSSTTDGNHISDGKAATWRFTAPQGTGFAANTTVKAAFAEKNGLRGTIYVSPDSGSSVTFGQRSGSGVRSYTFGGGSASAYRTLNMRVRCSAPDDAAVCPGTNASEAFLRAYDLDMMLNDTAPPTVVQSGPAFSAGWHSGAQTVDVAAHDEGGGVRTIEVLVNGAVALSQTYSCKTASPEADIAASLRPCAASEARSYGVAATAFADGQNLVQTCVEDFSSGSAPNRSCSGETAVFVDNSAPASPRSLRLLGDSGWRADNAFSVAWRNPEGDAPIVGARYRVTGPGGYDSGVRSQDGNQLTHLDGLAVPRAGDYTISVWLRDAAGNESEANSDFERLRFDDTPPPSSAPRRADGWLSRGDFPYLQRWDEVSADGVLSGIKGFAVLIDERPDSDPCRAVDRCTEAETGFKPATEHAATIRSLSEGSHWAHVATVSGSGVKSAQVRHAELRVDKTDPLATIAGIPGGWTNQTVALSVHATDELSGMAATAGDDGRPLTAIQVDGGSAQTAAAPTDVTAAITSEGIHSVRYWARDLAGNANDGSEAGHEPAAAVVRIDRTPPSAWFASDQDPADPELVRASANDGLSGVRGGQIAYRATGSGAAYKPLITSFDAERGELTARFPSDQLARGEYEFIVEATDLAGNRSTSSLRQDGRRMTLTNPLKSEPVLTIRWDTAAAHAQCKPPRSGDPAERKRQRAAYTRCLAERDLAQTATTVSYGAPATIEGALVGTGGEPIAGATVELVEHLDRGAMPSERRTAIRTDGAGRYAGSLPPGPSRTIVIRYPGGQRFAPTETPAIRETVLGAVTLSASPGKLHNGQAVQFAGSVAHDQAQLPASGKLIQIQYFDPPRGRWRPVEILRSDADGGFHYAYEFRTIAATTKIRFRALAMAEDDWPYAAAASATRVVTVYP
ncbi:MAG: hypothetical protein QOG26_1221 [Solirubrobacterales bacterium]|nr:hypothetical protein [Solirubrobacterales bacterium]